MTLLLVGLNHKTAPLGVRETLSFSDEHCEAGLRKLVDGEVVREGLIVSTCNRVEVLLESAQLATPDAHGYISRFLSQFRAVPEPVFQPYLYSHSDHAAVRHIFRVASSLDSLVVGEPQILGQVRRAYSTAVAAGTAGRVLNKLVHQAFHVAKRVRTETGVGASAVSVSYMAVELGKKLFGTLEKKTVLVLGAGEMAELATRHLVSAGATRVIVSNRTHAAAQKLADAFGGTAVPFESLAQSLCAADIVICSTAAPEFVITQQMAERALAARRGQPVFLIDISVPRNIDPKVGALANMYLFDVDDLEAVVTSNMREREREAERAELIVAAEVLQFEEHLRIANIGPALGALRRRMQDLARAEMARQRARLGQLTPDQERAIENMLVATVNKISHPVMLRLRQAYEQGELELFEAWYSEFHTEPDPDERAPERDSALD